MLGSGATTPFPAPVPPTDNGGIQSLQGYMVQKGAELVSIEPVM